MIHLGMCESGFSQAINLTDVCNIACTTTDPATDTQTHKHINTSTQSRSHARTQTPHSANWSKYVFHAFPLAGRSISHICLKHFPSFPLEDPALRRKALAARTAHSPNSPAPTSAMAKCSLTSLVATLELCMVARDERTTAIPLWEFHILWKQKRKRGATKQLP